MLFQNRVQPTSRVIVWLYFKTGYNLCLVFCLVIFTHLDWITFYNYFFKTYPLAGLYHGALTRLWFKKNLIVYVKLLSLIVITQF